MENLLKTSQQTVSNGHSTRITYVGHATVLIEIGGVRILTDPILRDRVYHLRRKRVSIASSWQEDIDAVLISHGHGDHLDLPSLRRLHPSTRLIAPAGAEQLLWKRGFRQIEAYRAGETLSIGHLKIQTIRANHHGKRFGYPKNIECLGYLINAGCKIYFPGDTDLFPEMAELNQDLDVALMPVWGWGPSLGPGHMDPLRAAQALEMLQPRIAIPIHWGTLSPLMLNWLSPSFMIDPPHAFSRIAANKAPKVDIKILNPGETISNLQC